MLLVASKMFHRDKQSDGQRQMLVKSTQLLDTDAELRTQSHAQPPRNE